MARNIELKARLRDYTAAEGVCEKLEANHSGDIRQRDTYFNVADGRLKLRESDPGDDYLVHYRRADVAEARGCDYTIAIVPRDAKPVLVDALGVLVVVDKTRALHLWHNVRIHLDRVDSLGEFIEFEAVLSDEHTDADGFTRLAHLREAFDIRDEDIVPVSYLDLTLERTDSD